MKHVVFLEWTRAEANPVAIVEMRDVARRLESLDGFLNARVLHNTTDNRVYLLETAWIGVPPILDVANLGVTHIKARVWTFEWLDS